MESPFWQEEESGDALESGQKKVVHPAGLEPTTYCSGGSVLQPQKRQKTAVFRNFSVISA